jgi:signal transduction histidine kinase
VSSFSQRSGIVARLVAVGGERRLDPDRELALLRIVQEALRNVEQHARARRAQVRLQYKPGAVRLTVSDDGQGMPDRPRSDLVGAGKLGLIGMGEQARLIDASLSIGASPDGGTRITVDLHG